MVKYRPDVVEHARLRIQNGEGLTHQQAACLLAELEDAHKQLRDIETVSKQTILGMLDTVEGLGRYLRALKQAIESEEGKAS